jgi:hypothetical protein
MSRTSERKADKAYLSDPSELCTVIAELGTPYRPNVATELVNDDKLGLAPVDLLLPPHQTDGPFLYEVRSEIGEDSSKKQRVQ